MATFTALIAASADDAEEVGGTSVIDGLTISSDSATDFGGARFLLVAIPKGSTIQSAFLTVEPSSNAEDEPNHTFYCEAADDAATFTTDASNISGRSRTTRSVLWDSADLGASGTSRHNTPDLSGIVGEVISRAGWVSGNALAFIWHGSADAARDLTIKSFDTGASDGPELTVVFTPPGIGGKGRKFRRPLRKTKVWTNPLIDAPRRRFMGKKGVVR